VGIINQGKIVAEGTPESLKHSVGSDVIVAKVVGEAALAAAECQKLRGVAGAEIHGDEVTLSVAQGSAVIGPVAIALNACGVEVRELTLRTPTLDDVFLHYTGARLEAEATEEQSE